MPFVCQTGNNTSICYRHFVKLGTLMKPATKVLMSIVAVALCGVVSSPLWTQKIRDQRDGTGEWQEKVTHINGR